jgi:hypothetical protein
MRQGPPPPLPKAITTSAVMHRCHGKQRVPPREAPSGLPGARRASWGRRHHHCHWSSTSWGAPPWARPQRRSSGSRCEHPCCRRSQPGTDGQTGKQASLHPSNSETSRQAVGPCHSHNGQAGRPKTTLQGKKLAQWLLYFVHSLHLAGKVHAKHIAVVERRQLIGGAAQAAGLARRVAGRALRGGQHAHAAPQHRHRLALCQRLACARAMGSNRDGKSESRIRIGSELVPKNHAGLPDVITTELRAARTHYPVFCPGGRHFFARHKPEMSIIGVSLRSMTGNASEPHARNYRAQRSSGGPQPGTHFRAPCSSTSCGTCRGSTQTRRPSAQCPALTAPSGTDVNSYVHQDTCGWRFDDDVTKMLTPRHNNTGWAHSFECPLGGGHDHNVANADRRAQACLIPVDDLGRDQIGTKSPILHAKLHPLHPIGRCRAWRLSPVWCPPVHLGEHAGRVVVGPQAA